MDEDELIIYENENALINLLPTNETNTNTGEHHFSISLQSSNLQSSKNQLFGKCQRTGYADQACFFFFLLYIHL